TVAGQRGLDIRRHVSPTCEITERRDGPSESLGAGTARRGDDPKVEPHGEAVARRRRRECRAAVGGLRDVALQPPLDLRIDDGDDVVRRLMPRREEWHRASDYL